MCACVCECVRMCVLAGYGEQPLKIWAFVRSRPETDLRVVFYFTTYWILRTLTLLLCCVSRWLDIFKSYRVYITHPSDSKSNWLCTALWYDYFFVDVYFDMFVYACGYAYAYVCILVCIQWWFWILICIFMSICVYESILSYMYNRIYVLISIIRICPFVCMYWWICFSIYIFIHIWFYDVSLWVLILGETAKAGKDCQYLHECMWI